MKDIQCHFNNTQDDIPTLQDSNCLSIIKENNQNDTTQKIINIPFISKLSDEKKEELETKKKKQENDKKKDIKDEDEIDTLLNRISRNNVSKGTNKGKIIVEDKATLDFDQDVTVDIQKINSNRFVNYSNNNSNMKNSDNYSNNNTISNYFQKTQQTIQNNKTIPTNKEVNQIKSPNKDRISAINTSSITNIPIKNQMGGNNSNHNSNQGNIKTNLVTNNNVTNLNNNNVAKLNYTQIKRIIDVSVVNNQTEIANSDLILCILELCINSIYYGFKYSNKSKIFWENLLKKNEYKNIFANFKPETLKKYWITLSEIKDFNKTVDLINKNKNFIDRKELKLLPIISNLMNFLKGKIENFESGFLSLMGGKDKKNNFQFIGNKRNPDENIEENLKDVEEKDLEKDLIKGKTESEDDPVLIDDATMELILQEENSKRATLIKNKEIPVSRNKVIVANEKDKRQFEQIDEIIRSIQESFSRTKGIDLDKVYILEVLKMHSFNIVNTYLYLCSPEERKDFCFTDVDDYIIKNMKSSDYFKDMLAKKGKQTVYERERFLMIDHFDY